MRARPHNIGASTPPTISAAERLRQLSDDEPAPRGTVSKRGPLIKILLFAAALSTLFFYCGVQFGHRVAHPAAAASPEIPLAPASLLPPAESSSPPPPSSIAPPLPPFPPFPPLPAVDRPEELLSEIRKAPDNAKQPCLSFLRDPCPPLNLSIQTAEEQKETHKYCGPYVQLERGFNNEPVTGPKAPRFCGQRLRRLNPCWREQGVTSCLPHFFILGEMKCGTTSLYHFLRMHPRVVVPRVKEPRFLQAGRFPQTTVSRYKVNFETAAAKADAVTFDASPVYLRSQIARAWLARWLPRSHLITIVRNPSQRAFSHVQMGLEWTENKCTEEHQIRTLRPLRPLLTFDKLMERSLIQMHWQECERLHPGQGIKKAPASFKWLMLPPEEVAKIRAYRIGNKKDEEARLAAAGDPSAQLPPSGAPLWDCLRQMDADLMREYEPELLGDWPPLHEKSGLDQAVQLIGQCSEMMLFPPGALTKGSSYAEELERWAQLFPKDQMKVLHTDELANPIRAQKIMDETFGFLGLHPISIGNETRMCVHGKAGVMDVLNSFESSVRIGTKGAAPEQINVGRCDITSKVAPAGMHREEKFGALHHTIEPKLLKRLRRYYEPSNQRLYKFLGRNLGW